MGGPPSGVLPMPLVGGIRLKGRHCMTCNHPKRAEVEAGLLRGMMTHAQAAAIIGVHENTIKRHLSRCISRRYGVAMAKRSDAGGWQLEGIAQEAITEARDNLKRARDSFNLKTGQADLSAANGAITAMTRAVETLGRLTGQIQSQSVVLILKELGVGSLDEAKSRIRDAQAVDAPPDDLAFDDCIRLLRSLITRHPEWRDRAQGALFGLSGASYAEVEPEPPAIEELAPCHNDNATPDTPSDG